MSKFYITTAIDYVNSIPHLGTAYEKIAADAIARYKRLAGFDTRFLMGNDEHSTNVEKAAREKGLDPKVYCDQMAEIFRASGSGSTSPTTTSSGPPSRATSAAFRSCSERSRRTATSTRGSTKASTALAASASIPRKSSSRGNAPTTRPSRSG